MTDLWNVPTNAHLPDVLTARVAEGMRYGFTIRYRISSQRELARKQLAHALGIDRGTLRRYLEPVLDEQCRILSGPTKVSLLHDMILKMGVRPSQLYGAAETSNSLNEYLGEVTRIFLAPPAESLAMAFIPVAQAVAQTLGQLS